MLTHTAHAARCPNRVGSRCPNSSMRKWSNNVLRDVSSLLAIGLSMAVWKRLRPCWRKSVGQVITTAFMERLNLSIRQHVSALGRKATTLAKGEAGLDDLLTLYQAYYNFCLPHAALRLALLEPRPTKGTGSYQKWTPRTPAMAASITNRIWRMEELLLFRVPPWPQRQTLPV